MIYNAMSIPVLQSAATISLTDHQVTGLSVASSYAFSCSFGPASVGRLIAFGVYGVRAAAGARSITSATIGGVSATLVKAKNSLGGNATEIWQASVSAGTSGTISMTWNSSMTAVGIAVFSISGANTTVSGTNSTSAAPMAASISVAARGVILSMAGDENSNSYTWTNLTERSDELSGSAGGSAATSACDSFTTAQAGLTVTATTSGAQSDGAMCVAAWGPAT